MPRKPLATLLAALIVASAALTRADSPPASIQGTIASATKDSFKVTLKKSEVEVKINADTRFVLDDKQADAKALITGYDVNAILSPDGNAFVVIVNSVAIKGTAKSIAADKASFIVTAKKGLETTVKVTPATKYILDKKESTIEAALAPDNTITADLGPDGSAVTVTAKKAKQPKTPPTPEAPATPTPPVTPAN